VVSARSSVPGRARACILCVHPPRSAAVRNCRRPCRGLLLVRVSVPIVRVPIVRSKIKKQSQIHSCLSRNPHPTLSTQTDGGDAEILNMHLVAISQPQTRTKLTQNFLFDSLSRFHLPVIPQLCWIHRPRVHPHPIQLTFSRESRGCIF